jgi:hypothetical protein
MADLPHVHAPVQHRDGKPPWCRVCGLTANGTVPESRFGKHPAGQQVAQVIPPQPTTEELARKWFEEDEQEAQDAIGFSYEPRPWTTAHPDLKAKYIARVQEARGLR